MLARRGRYAGSARSLRRNRFWALFSREDLLFRAMRWAACQTGRKMASCPYRAGRLCTGNWLNPLLKTDQQPMPAKPIAVGYIRVSTDEQKLGPQAQEKALRAWCKKHGVKLVSVHTDEGVSGGLELEKRPALVAAIDSVKEHGAIYLVAHKRDRVARDREVMGTLGLMLRRMGCTIQTTDRPPKDADDLEPFEKAMDGITDVFAEFERSMIRARTKAALALKKARGERTGNVPYGYTLDEDGVHLTEDPDEQVMVEYIKELREDGCSLRTICEYLEGEGFEPRSGERFYPSTIKRILEFVPPGEIE